MPGLQTFRITDAGLEVYPRLSMPSPLRARPQRQERQSTGVLGLDDMMGGGIPVGDSVLLTGPTGSGKTILATQFVTAGVKRGECAVIAVFEEHPDRYIQRATSLGFDLGDMIARGKLEVMYLRPLDLSVDETLKEIEDRITRLGATRAVIDSLSGFEVALAPTFRQDFRESFYRLVQALGSLGVTVISTVEVVEASDYLRFAPFNISFLADDILAMRYVEMEGELRKVLSVIKMRSSAHGRALRAYEVTSHGLELREELRDYRGIITGVPERRSGVSEVASAELTTTEAIVLDTILRLGETPADAVTRETALTDDQVRHALERLLAVHYIRAVHQEGQTLYRAAPRALG
jgi:circadian clock protein KaiC